MYIEKLKKKLLKEMDRGNFMVKKDYMKYSKEHFVWSEEDLMSAKIEHFILTNEEMRKNPIFSSYQTHRWIIVKCYYSMYHCVLGLLAELGIKTETHFATLLAFELFFVKRVKLIDEKYFDMILKILERVGIIPFEYLKMVKNREEKRFFVQYDVTVSIPKREAKESLEAAEKFTEKMKMVFENLRKAKGGIDTTI